MCPKITWHSALATTSLEIYKNVTSKKKKPKWKKFILRKFILLRISLFIGICMQS